MQLLLPYTPPYTWEQVLGFLSDRTVDGVEQVRNGEYSRTVRVRRAGGIEATGWIRVVHRETKGALELQISGALQPAKDELCMRVRRQFDLAVNPHAVHSQLETLGKVMVGLPVLRTRIPGAFEPFEKAVRAILGQQVTVTFARTLANRIVAAYGTPIDTGMRGLTRIFPTPHEVVLLSDNVEDHLGKLGVLSARSHTIAALAEGIVSGDLDLDYPEDPEEQRVRLLAIRGIGPWTAGYIAMRTMGMTDEFLPTDAGIKKAVAPLTPTEAAAYAQQWSPWRSYAMFALWDSL